MTGNILLPIALQLIGVVVIIAEIIIPSGGLLSALAIGIFGYSLFMVFSGISFGAGVIFASVDAIMIPVLVIVGLKLLAKSPATLRRRLSREEGVSSQSPELENYKGCEGVAATDLRPAGVARIDGKRVDVVSRGEYIDKDTHLVVMEVTGNRVVVREKDNP
jgi:membrane-bound ClpP family serine protease